MALPAYESLHEFIADLSGKEVLVVHREIADELAYSYGFYELPFDYLFRTAQPMPKSLSKASLPPSSPSESLKGALVQVIDLQPGEGSMKRQVLFIIALMAMPLFTLPWPAVAQNRPEIYVSLFAGGNVPSNTDVTEVGPTTNITVQDVKLKRSATLGGKIGLYATQFRNALGVDLGAELDVTHFSPDQVGNQVKNASGTVGGVPVIGAVTSTISISSTVVTINFLLRKPFGVTEEMPNGSWYPYVGVGGGLQTSSFSPPGTVKEGRETDPAFQGMAGVNVFLTQQIALFGEYKFTHASHTFSTQSATTGATTTDKYTFDVNHFVAGLAVHF